MHSARWVWGLVLAASRLEKTEQVVLKARAICAEDPPPDL